MVATTAGTCCTAISNKLKLALHGGRCCSVKLPAVRAFFLCWNICHTRLVAAASICALLSRTRYQTLTERSLPRTWGQQQFIAGKVCDAASVRHQLAVIGLQGPKFGSLQAVQAVRKYRTLDSYTDSGCLVRFLLPVMQANLVQDIVTLPVATPCIR